MDYLKNTGRRCKQEVGKYPRKIVISDKSSVKTTTKNIKNPACYNVQLNLVPFSNRENKLFFCLLQNSCSNQALFKNKFMAQLDDLLIQRIIVK